MNKNVYSVSEVNTYIERMFKDDFMLGNLSLRKKISREDKEGNRDQGEGIACLKHALNQNQQFPLPKAGEHRDPCSGTDGEGDRNTEHQKQNKDTKQNKTHLSLPPSGDLLQRHHKGVIHAYAEADGQAHIDIFHLDRQCRRSAHLLVAIHDAVIEQRGKEAEAERVAAEQAEAERIAAEQAEAERIAAEEAERAAAEEAERAAAEEAERAAAEAAKAEETHTVSGSVTSVSGSSITISTENGEKTLDASGVSTDGISEGSYVTVEYRNGSAVSIG